MLRGANDCFPSHEPEAEERHVRVQQHEEEEADARARVLDSGSAVKDIDFLVGPELSAGVTQAAHEAHQRSPHQEGEEEAQHARVGGKVGEAALPRVVHNQLTGGVWELRIVSKTVDGLDKGILYLELTGNEVPEMSDGRQLHQVAVPEPRVALVQEGLCLVQAGLGRELNQL